MGEVRSGAPVFRTDVDSRICEWNAECERLTGISAADAEDHYCWEVLAGRDANGGIVCHPGCSIARLARQGWPVRCTELYVRTAEGRKAVTVSTIVLRQEHETTVLHPLSESTNGAGPPPRTEPDPPLTPRQREILQLLADGQRVRQIAAHLTIAEATVRNHVRAILRALGVNSQLEAVARARTLTPYDA